VSRRNVAGESVLAYCSQVRCSCTFEDGVALNLLETVLGQNGRRASPQDKCIREIVGADEEDDNAWQSLVEGRR
jgi:hypothetical protein